MDEFDLTESFVQDDQENQFLGQDFRYEKCPHCERNFFIGKLKYHLKLCKPSNPMIKSPMRRNKKSHFSATAEKPLLIEQQNAQSPKPTLSPQSKYKKCEYCRATFPLSMIKRHSQKCNLKPNLERKSEDINQIQSRTNVNFQFKKDTKQPSSILPRIRNSARQHKNYQRNFVSQDLKEGRGSYTVKIRQELSCFKKALQVQQVECPFCSRKFSRDASLRHIPICQKLKNQQIQQIALKKHAKSQIYKSTIPIKKSILFRQKATSNANRGESQLEVKSARLPKPQKIQKVDRQKVNNTSFFKIQDSKKEKLRSLQSSVYERKQSNHCDEKPSQNLLQVKNTVSISNTNMNMTFNKAFNEPMLQVDKKIQLSTENLEKQLNSSDVPSKEDQIENQDYDSESFEEKMSEMENQFLQVSVSKKKIFEQIDLKQNQTAIETKNDREDSLEHPFLKNIKLKISLKDIQGQLYQKDIKEKLQEQVNNQ